MVEVVAVCVVVCRVHRAYVTGGERQAGVLAAARRHPPTAPSGHTTDTWAIPTRGPHLTTCNENVL